MLNKTQARTSLENSIYPIVYLSLTPLNDNNCDFPCFAKIVNQHCEINVGLARKRNACSPTGIPSHVERVAGVAGGRPCVGTLGLALLAVHHQLHPVALFAGGDGVPTTVAVAVTLGRVLRRDHAGPVVHMEEELCGGRAEKLAVCTCGPMRITEYMENNNNNNENTNITITTI